MFNLIGGGKVIFLKGRPYEQGIQYGSQLKEDIIANVYTIKRYISKEKVIKEIKKSETIIRDLAPEIIEELEGISKGSGVAYEDLLLLNLGFVYWMWGPNRVKGDCTCMLAMRDATVDGKTYLLKNRDLPKADLRQSVIVRKFGDGAKIVVDSITGCISIGSGVNSRNILVASTGVFTEEHNPGLDVQLIMHLILTKACSVDEAIELVRELQINYGGTIICADLKNAVCMEIHPEETNISYSENGVIWRTNHFITPKMKKYNVIDISPSTIHRYNRAKELLSSHIGKIRLNEMFKFASDHINGLEYSICRHAGVFKTMSSSIFVLEDLDRWTILGNPCKFIAHFQLESKMS